MKEHIIEYCAVDIDIKDMFLDDTYDKALLGMSFSMDSGFSPAYDLDKITDILMETNNIDYSEALNKFNLNLLEQYPMISFIKLTDESREDLSTYNNDMLFLDGYQSDCLVGIRVKKDCKIIAIYDDWLCVQSLINNDGMEEDEAIEHFEYNTRGAYVGENTPSFLTLL
jgi:hypothetical protein